ncbi:family 78 glycoside hydrolase catalytic domain [Actinoplanes sp. NPDC051470]|uniref:family 78 glycoside hydrolase catalytic domain n=1 Tax=Actinoplanes sp. NPDC051470 TaxID=3157224 RepID=UPI003449DD44
MIARIATVLILLAPTPAVDNHAPQAPTGLTVGDRADPLGVEGAPQFGWLPVDADPGEVQSAYQIRVFTGNTQTQVWDSGKVVSRETAYVPYGGPALTPGATYRWAMRTWDRANAVSVWSSNAYFDTALPDTQWQASWIRRTTAEADDYTLARKEFRVTGSRVVRARLFVSAGQQYQAYVNGRRVDDGPAFAYPGEGYYQVTDVTADLAADSRAAIGVLYHWYGPGQGRPAGAPGLLARLEVNHADGSRQVIGTDATWLVARGPWLPAAYRNGDGRDYIEHGLPVPSGWASPGFAATGWTAPSVVASPGPLRAQRTRLAHTSVAPVSVTTLPSGAVVADFGRVIPAVPRVSFASGLAGRVVDLVAGFVLNADGSVANTPDTNQDTDLTYRYTQRDGDQTFEAFTYEGFRYLQVSSPADISAVVQHTDADPARSATFTSSDATLNAVFQLMRRSALYSTQEQFLDTPTREKGQFLADAVNISRALMAGSGDRNATARAIREFIASQQRYWPDGRLNAVYPNGDGKRDIPDFTEMFPGWVWDYYQASGDRAVLADAFGASSAIAGYVRRYVDPATGLVTRLDGGSGAYQYGIIDWPNRYGYDTDTVARTTVNILAVDVLRSTAQQASALGRPQTEIDALRTDADAIAAAVNSRLRRPDGIYIDGLAADGTQSTHASQIANAYAIAYGVAPAADHPVLADHLESLKLQMGPMTADTLIEALHVAGRDRAALARLTDPSTLGWANVLSRGGTFTWESWEAPERGDSMSHGWGSAALTSVLSDLLGVRPTAPAARTVEIAPPTGTTLTSASGTVWTQSGPITVTWSGTSVTATIPTNVTATIRVGATVATVGSGTHTITG